MHDLTLPPAVTGRIVFADTEFTTLDKGRRELWEGAIIIRDPGEEDLEFAWQVRPPLKHASPDSLRVGGYYRRNRLIGQPVGTGLIIAHAGMWAELKPGEDFSGNAGAIGTWPTGATALDAQVSGDGPAAILYPRQTTAVSIAAQVARALDGVTLVAAVPSADELALDRWLARHGQVLTSHYRIKCIETLMQGYLLGQARLHGAEDPGRGPASVPPYDPKPMYEAIGVPLLGPDKAHNALHDCFQVRDAWDAMHGARIDTIR